ncbi:MAG TPA: hypothetical protein VLG92_04505 [Candidatus Saccharimonadia bacterium]|nr:hypothetical protein [Candidatus Saccharimonadia bacterium]
MPWYQLAGFTIYLLGLVYGVNCLIARSWRTVSIRPASVYIAAVATIGVFGEVFVGTVYHHLFGRPLWVYRVAPIHYGYTSRYAPCIWGALGFYLYLLHDYLKARGTETVKHLALLFASETVILELILSASFKLVFGVYLFYYLPGDLWHFTSLQTLPFYLPAGVLIVKSVRRLIDTPHFSLFFCSFLILVFVYMAN